jgi:hypothetical protein
MGIVMLLGALTLTGLLAMSLQNRADESQSVPGSYSPTDGATVDPSGWPIGELKDGPANSAGAERSRSRLTPGPADSGA